MSQTPDLDLGATSLDPVAALGGAPAMARLRAQLSGQAGGSPLDPYAINALAVLYALESQKEKESRELPFMQPGKAMANNALVPEGYAPNGTVFTGGSPYTPPYAAQNVAAAGMLVGNLLEAYKRNRKGQQDALSMAANAAP